MHGTRREIRIGSPASPSPRLLLLATAIATGLAGCGGPSASRPRHDTDVAATDSERSFAEQLAAVRAGGSSRIIVGSPPAAAEWESLRGLAGLKELSLRRGVADDAKAEILATLPDLERLVLRESPLTDAGFRSVARCRTLRDLNVPQAACTAAGIRSLAAIPSLQSLRLGGASLSGGEVGRAVAALSHLRSIHLIDIRLGDEGLAAISGMKGLWNLYLDGAGVSDAAWERYFHANPDVHVHVDQAHHDRDPGRDHH